MIPAIDILCYLFSPEAVERNWYQQEEMRRLLEWWSIEMKGRSVEEFLAERDAAGIERTCIPAVKMMSFQTKRTIWNDSAEEVARLVNQGPDRFIGLAGFSPWDKMDGVREVERAIRELGFKGVYIHTYGFGIPLGHAHYYPLYAKCAELGVPVIMQVGHSAEAMPSDLGRPIHLDEVALYFPQLKIVGAHTGWPWVEEMIALAWKHPNVFIGIDAHFPRYLDAALLQFMKTRGKNKVLFGTNGLPAHVIRAQFEELGLSDEVKRKILRENAERVLGL